MKGKKATRERERREREREERNAIFDRTNTLLLDWTFNSILTMKRMLIPYLGRWSKLRDVSLEKLGRRGTGDVKKGRKLAKQMLKEGIPKGDPYTRFLYPNEFERLAKYDVSGIGINLGTEEEYVTRVDTKGTPASSSSKEGGGEGREGEKAFDQFFVLGVIKDSPSERAGIQQGDRLVSIGEERPRGLTPLPAAQMINQKQKDDNRGRVQLTFQKGSDGRVVDFAVQGKTSSPITTDLEPAVKFSMRRRQGAREGYIKLFQFNARAPMDVKRALQQLDQQGADYFVLDLRDNLGGLVPAGVEVSRFFLGSEKPVVYTMAKDGVLRDRAPHPNEYQPPLTDKPLVLLVNKSTASASEIVAGALKDNCRATLVGDTTFGKGLIQSVYELSDGSGLVVTVGKYVTPSQIDIDRQGVSASFRNIPSLTEQQEFIAACKIK